MKHIFLIDSLSKLDYKKDSSLMLALTLQKLGKEIWLLFENDFYWKNGTKKYYNLYSFEGEFEENGCYLKKFVLGFNEKIAINKNDCIHMRLDPPFDTRYLRYLWMLKALKIEGIKVVNDPVGILCHNEKLYAFEQKKSLSTYIGVSSIELNIFLDDLKKKGYNQIVMKPLDLYQGIGVEKVDLESCVDVFNKKIHDIKGPVIVQPFFEEIKKGEIRSIYFKGNELGSILKIPKEGDFLTNIARGASYEAIKLSDNQKQMCKDVCNDLSRYGISWIAFDIMGDYLSEVNITCPGLLVEVSAALKKNLSFEISELF